MVNSMRLLLLLLLLSSSAYARFPVQGGASYPPAGIPLSTGTSWNATSIPAATTGTTWLSYNGTSYVWGTPSGSGTVTSVGVSGGTTGLTVSGSPVTNSGTITLSGTLAAANGGTGVTSLGTGIPLFFGTPSFTNFFAALTGVSGTASSTTYLRGDGSWATPTGSGTVTSSGSPVSGNISVFTTATNIAPATGAQIVTAIGTNLSASNIISGTLPPGQLPTTGTAGTYGGNVTTDAYGRVTAATLGSPSISVTTGRALASTDLGKTLVCNSSSPVSITVPNDSTLGSYTGTQADGFTVTMVQAGTGACSFTASGGTINGSTSAIYATGGQYQAIAIQNLAAGLAASNWVNAGNNGTVLTRYGSGTTSPVTLTSPVSGTIYRYIFALNGSGNTTAALTVVMPTSPPDGAILEFSFLPTITALTFTGTPPLGMTSGGTVVGKTGGRYVYSAADSLWVPIS